MRPPHTGLWKRVPGYDSNSESDDDAEATITADRAQERLKVVTTALGDTWIATETVHFKPANLPSKDAPRQSTQFPLHSMSVPPPLTFRIASADMPVVRETLLSNGMVSTMGYDWMVMWSGHGQPESTYLGLHEWQRINHFPGSTELTRKDRLWSHFALMAHKFGSSDFDFVPETFVLPDQVEEFLECYERTNNLWIVKPNASSQGKGIFLLRNLGDLPLDELSVVSQYVDRPLLIQGLKFDLRVYVLVTGFDPLRAYIYREGLVRFASMPYSTDDEHLQDAYRHLTNYSINKKASNFVENEGLQEDHVGHKWSLSALNKHLRCVGFDVELMWVRIMDLVVKTLLSVEPSIIARTREIAPSRLNCFELYGFDVLVDEDLKPWLLEVNLSPSMQAESPLDWQVKSSLLSDAFNLVGIHRVDRHVVAGSKMRQRAPQLRRSTSGPTSTSRQPTSSARRRRSSSSAQVGEDSNASRECVALDSLEEDELKALAHALQERKRCRNFIALYPTASTVGRYSPIIEANGSWKRGQALGHGVVGGGGAPSLTQIHASLLLGPPPLRPGQSCKAVAPGASAARGVAGAADRIDGASDGCALFGNVSPTSTRSRSKAMVKAPGALVSKRAPESIDEKAKLADAAGDNVAASISVMEKESWLEAEKALKKLGSSARTRLVLMEYLTRISNTCAALGPAEKAKLGRSTTCLRLAAFRIRLRGKLWKLGRAGQVRHASGTGVHPESTGARDYMLEEEAAANCMETIADDLADACQAMIVALARSNWTQEADADMVEEDADDDLPSYVNGGESELCRQLPMLFARRPSTRRALTAIGSLTALELERLLQGPWCSADCQALLQPWESGPKAHTVELPARQKSNPRSLSLRGGFGSAGFDDLVSKTHAALALHSRKASLLEKHEKPKRTKRRRALFGPLTELQSLPRSLHARGNATANPELQPQEKFQPEEEQQDLSASRSASRSGPPLREKTQLSQSAPAFRQSLAPETEEPEPTLILVPAPWARDIEL